MKKLLNVVTLILGIFFVIGGFLFKGGIDMGAGENAVHLNYSSSIFYLVVVRLIGGLSIIYHSATTFRFEKRNIENNLKALSGLQQITGVIIYLISFYLVVDLISNLAYFGNRIADSIMIIVMLLLLKTPIIVFSILLVSKNFSINKQIGKK